MMETVRLRDLPGVAELEAALQIPGRQLLPEYDDLEKRIEDVSRRLFGITESETNYVPKKDEIEIIPALLSGNGLEYRRLNDDGERAKAQWENHFEFLEFEFEEEDVFWSAVGWDVADENGDQLAIMDYFGRQIVCLLKGLHPRARLSITGNDPLIKPEGFAAEQEAEEWGRKLADEARQFRRKA